MIEINKIYNGNCLELFKLIPNNFIDLIITDPPFNQQKDYDKHNDNMLDEEYFFWCNKWLKECFRVLKSTGSIYVQINSKKVIKMGSIMNKYGIFQNQCIWIKHTAPTPQTKRYAKNYQPWLFYTKTEDYYFNHDKKILHRYKPYEQIGDRNKDGRMVDDIWEDICDLAPGFLAQKEVILINGKKAHNQQMPLALAKRMILHSSKPNDIILDCFAGTGTTLVLAKQLNRKYIGFESSYKYCQIIKERLRQGVLF